MIFISAYSKDKELRIRLLAVDLLKELKNSYTYKELSKLLNIQESLLCRYVNGNTIPSEVHSKEILDKIRNEEFLIKFFYNKISFREDGYIDTSSLLFYPNMLKMLIEIYYQKYLGRKEISKIATIAVNGIPFATLTAEALAKPLIIMKKHKDSIHLEYLDENLKESEGIVTSIYLRKDYINRDDKVLLIDDVIRTGTTIHVAYKLLSKGGADVVGAITIAAVGKEWIKHANTINIYPIFRL
ncbi:phosphoribosyltransferase [Stygiolobus caldivivus]|uniref:Phosphoribosyltransferase n=1 Tax=Stygiolobus caldivivus TaxID=2824673 RepID=A0A8D5ZJU0_9CREN|nr:phosphoribosyltransferase [Stygiolobus caldivivus]